MAKRKRKKKSIAVNLKYEVYGILLVTISVIALSGEAAVGRSLSKLFALMLGKFYFVLALVGIYIGLVVMVKRVWPRGWSTKKTGIVVFVLALTLMSAISEIDRKLVPTTALSAQGIMAQLGGDLRSELLSPQQQPEVPMMQKAISGGYIGATQYALLYSLFGYFASKFILVVMFLISLMLMTGKSFVELIKLIQARGTRFAKLLKLKLFPPNRKQRARRRTEKPAKEAEPDYEDDEEDEDYEEDWQREPAAAQAIDAQPAAKKKRSLFFNWLLSPDGDKQAAEQAKAEDETPLEESKDQTYATLYISNEQPASYQEQSVPPWEDEPSDAYSNTHPNEVTDAAMQQASLTWDEPAQEQEEAADGVVRDHPASLSEALVGPEEVADEAGPAAIPPVKQPKPYRLPSLTLLAKPPGPGRSAPSDMVESRRKLEATLESFGVRANVLDVVRGPAVTRYEVQPATGVKVSRIVGLTDDIALALAAKDIRMEAPIPGKSAIGIEVPNTEVSVVTMREVMETTAFQHAPSRLSIAFGRDISGQPIIGDLARMPHLLVAGATGSGKSVCINGIITSILYKAEPHQVKFMMIDPKMVELNVYNGIPHLLAPVVTDPKRASLALKKIVVEMEKRYELFSKSSTRNIEGYNTLMADNPAAVLPYIVVIVDELADLMMVAAGDVEDAITRLAQMARAAGIHLIIATQRPSVDVITGVIKANIPSRIAFGVSSQVDSRTILDMVGAEKLLGRGDMLFLPVGMSKPIRVQGAFLSDSEVEQVVTFVRGQAEAEYREELVPEVEDMSDESGEERDDLYEQAVQIVVEAKQASASLLQRRMRIGHNRAGRLIDQLEAGGVIGPYEGSKPREVLISIEQYHANRFTS